jgi:hypothetical protein
MMRTETIPRLDRILYAAQHRHFGSEQAKAMDREIKGSQLLANNSFKMLQKYGYSSNLEVAKDIFRDCSSLSDNHAVRIFGAAIWGEKDVLKKVHEGKLNFPLVELLKRVSAACKEMEPSRTVHLVFDESLADRDISISICRFIKGVGLGNVSHYPMNGVSHVTPGIQLADIGAYILGRRAVGDVRFKPWLSTLRNLEWTGIVDGRYRMGIQRWDSDGTATVRVRKYWENTNSA